MPCASPWPPLLLITGLTAVLSIDDLPRPSTSRSGDLATVDVGAPRTLVFASAIETEAARQAARDAVPPQYDYKAETAAALTRRQLDALAVLLAPVDAAFAAGLAPEERRAALAETLPGLSLVARKTLYALAPERWSLVGAEATRVLGLVQRDALRDAELEAVRRNLGERFSAALTDDERGLATELVVPLLVPNATYSEALTADARDAAAAAVAPVSYPIQQGELIVEAGQQVTPLEIAKLEAFGLTEARLDVARLAGWFLLAVLVVVLLLAWTWRYRQELWHRARALALLGLVLLLTALAYKLTAGRSILPYFVPGAGRLDAGRDPPRRGAGHDDHGDAGHPGRRRERPLPRARRLRLRRGHDRDHRDPARRPGGDLPPGGPGHRRGQHGRRHDLLAAGDARPHGDTPAVGCLAGRGRGLGDRRRGHLPARRQPLRDPHRSSSSSSWPTRRNPSCGGSSSRRRGPTTTP